MDVIDVVIEFALAGVATVFAGVLLFRGRHGSTVTVLGKTVPHPPLWALASLLAGVVLVLRVGVEILPAGWQAAGIAATLVAAAAGLAVSMVAIARSRRP